VKYGLNSKVSLLSLLCKPREENVLFIHMTTIVKSGCNARLRNSPRIIGHYAFCIPIVYVHHYFIQIFFPQFMLDKASHRRALHDGKTLLIIGLHPSCWPFPSRNALLLPYTEEGLALYRGGHCPIQICPRTERLGLPTDTICSN